MKAKVPFALSPRYEGVWRFEYIMDYELRLRVKGQTLYARMVDLTREEECELIFVNACPAYITLAMDSSWGKLTLQLLPGEDCLWVDVHDVDYLALSDEQSRLPEGQAVVITTRPDTYPDWVGGWWRQGPQGVYIERVQPNALRLALFWGDDEERVFREFVELYSAGSDCLHFSLRSRRPHQVNTETRLYFHTERQMIVLRFHVLLRAELMSAAC